MKKPGKYDHIHFEKTNQGKTYAQYLRDAGLKPPRPEHEQYVNLRKKQKVT